MNKLQELKNTQDLMTSTKKYYIRLQQDEWDKIYEACPGIALDVIIREHTDEDGKLLERKYYLIENQYSEYILKICSPEEWFEISMFLQKRKNEE